MALTFLSIASLIPGVRRGLLAGESVSKRGGRIVDEKAWHFLVRMEYAFPLSSSDLTWLEKLLRTEFFVDCSVHGLLKKNLFCIHCGTSLCHQCALKHCSHPHLQVAILHFLFFFFLSEVEKSHPKEFKLHICLSKTV
ncbi:hypothetical protein EJ110_NYTH04003 [Nymphaea thermarum]|nr:hypothetical protein EJ110_NYTH04003 [Nymphaea thermarum]